MKEKFWTIIIWTNKHFFEIIVFLIPIISAIIFMCKAFYNRDILAVIYAGFTILIPLICYLILQIKTLISIIREFKDFKKKIKK